MDKKLLIVIAAALSVLLVASFAAAQGFWRSKENQQTGMMSGGMMKGMMGGMAKHHEQMGELFETGSYADLIKLREEQGFNMMPWVENEEDFQLAKKMHEKMEKSG